MEAERQHPVTMEETRNSNCKLGGFRWLATVSRPEDCARLVRQAAEVDVIQVGEVEMHCNNELIRTFKFWRPATALKSRAGRDTVGICLIRDGRARLGFLIALFPSPLDGSCHRLRRFSRFARRAVESSLGRGNLRF